MLARSILIYILVITHHVVGQNKFLTISDTVNAKRVISVSGSIGTVWTGSMIALYQVWYKNEPQVGFHSFNDGMNWLQMDKAGHFYTNYKISQLSGDLYKWSGVKPKNAALLGTAIGLGYQTTLEIFDGFSDGWGFSGYDMFANVLGGSFYLGQELLFKEERFIPKFSFHPTEFADLRPNVLGSNFPEQLLKDYNGQTYWLSFNPSLFFSNSKLPKWICLSVGYSVDSKIVGDEEIYTSIAGDTYHSRREFLLSMDIDFSRLPIKRPWLKLIVKQLNYLKVPFPALVLSDGKLSASGLYF
jgi:hypothetical protein